jgi:GNAT superfamily N-acetyltransferase
VASHEGSNKEYYTESLRDIPENCRNCIYWEYPEDFEKTRPMEQSKKPQFCEEKKNGWFLETLKEFGNFGKIVYHKNKPVGYAQYAPFTRLPQAKNYESKRLGKFEEGVIFLSCLYIPNKSMRRKGVGTKLLKHVVNDLKKRGFKAVETFARKGSSNNPSGPVELYLKEGFYVKEEIYSGYVLVQLDL